MLLFIALMSLIALPLLVYSIRIEPNWYDITHIDLKMRKLDLRFEGYRIVHISDIHMDGWTKSDWLADVVARVNALNPDCIVITGDFITRSASHIEPTLWDELANLHAPDGIMVVMGNHDYLSDIQSLRRVIHEIGFCELSNDYTRIDKNGAHFYIAGIDNITVNKARPDDLIAKLPNDAPAILLAHEPDIADVIAATNRFEAQLSGHTHGGQIRLPILGIIYKPYFGKKYLYGYYQLENNLQVYVTRGVGTVGLPMRFNCRPEITIHTLSAI